MSSPGALTPAEMSAILPSRIAHRAGHDLVAEHDAALVRNGFASSSCASFVLACGRACARILPRKGRPARVRRTAPARRPRPAPRSGAKTSPGRRRTPPRRRRPGRSASCGSGTRRIHRDSPSGRDCRLLRAQRVGTAALDLGFAQRRPEAVECAHHIAGKAVERGKRERPEPAQRTRRCGRSRAAG